MHRFIYALLFLILTNPCAEAQTTVAAKQDLTEKLISFETDRAETCWVDQHWELRAGGLLLKDFGRNDVEARQAVRTIRELGVNQYGTIGSPVPLMEYWLCNGQAPRGSVAGLRVFSFDPMALKVETAGGEWCLAEGQRALFKFGRQGAEAQQALAIIKKYGFSRLAVIGQAAPDMMIFLADNSALGTSRGHSSSGGRNHGDADAKEKPLQSQVAPGLLATPVVALLRTTPRADPGPRGAFASGQLQNLPSGRQLGAPTPPPDVSQLADRIAFDWRKAQVRHESDGWVLAVGPCALARFGEKEDEARQALTLAQHFRLTEQLAVGQPVAFRYFLVNGRPPSGVPLGLDARPFQPDALTVRNIEGHWALCDDGIPILSFGSSFAEAKKFLEVVRKERFDRIVTLGVSATDGMTLLLRSH